MNQHQAILQYLNEHGFITSFTAAVKLGVLNLSARVKELKAKGYPIADRTRVNLNRYGKTIKYKEFYLKGDCSQ